MPRAGRSQGKAPGSVTAARNTEPGTTREGCTTTNHFVQGSFNYCWSFIPSQSISCHVPCTQSDTFIPAALAALSASLCPAHTHTHTQKACPGHSPHVSDSSLLPTHTPSPLPLAHLVIQIRSSSPKHKAQWGHNNTNNKSDGWYLGIGEATRSTEQVCVRNNKRCLV